MKRNLKKICAGLLVMVLAAGLSGCSVGVNFGGSVFSGSSQGSIWDSGWRGFKMENLDYELLEADRWDGIDAIEGAEYLPDEQGWLVHNDGQALECDWMESAAEDCFLVGVYTFQYWDQVPVESYFFSNRTFENLEELENWVQEEQRRRYMSLMGIGLDYHAKDFTWGFWDEEKNLDAQLSARVLGLKSTDAVVNGSPGTIWDVQVFSDFDAKDAKKVRGYTTEVNLNQNGQQLMNWNCPAAENARVKRQVSFSTSGDSISRKTIYEGVPMEEDCSMSENRCRWTFDMPKITGRKLHMDPRMQVSNTDGSFVLEVRFEGSFQSGFFKKTAFDTGVCTVALPDL